MTDLEAEIERADLIAEALRSHQRLEQVEAEYHAKLHEYGTKARADVTAEYETRVRALQDEVTWARKTLAEMTTRYYKRGQRMLRMQKKLRARGVLLRAHGIE